MANIQTVTGKITRDELGVVSTHEHIFIELSGFFEKRMVKNHPSPETEKVNIENLGVLYRDPYAFKDNLIIDDFDMQLKEIMRFKAAGGATIVDATTIGIGRNPSALKDIAIKSGLNIIAGAGYYVGAVHPEELFHESAEQIAERIVCDLTEGMDGTDIKAGVIGEIGISEKFDVEEEKVLRAAAVAQKKTGVGVLVHINPWTTSGLKAVDILLSEGVKPERICICHIDVENREQYVLELLEKGVYVEFDNFGKEYYVEKEARRDGYGLFVNDRERVEFLRFLIEKGYLNQILLSCDVCLKILLRSYGGWGYDHVLTNIVPMMDEIGITPAQVDVMLKKNPADFLCEKMEEI